MGSCLYCNAAVEFRKGQGRRGRFCDVGCYASHKRETAAKGIRRVMPAGLTHTEERILRIIQRASSAEQESLAVELDERFTDNRKCADCGKSYRAAHRMHRYCSQRCSARVKQRRYRANSREEAALSKEAAERKSLRLDAEATRILEAADGKPRARRELLGKSGDVASRRGVFA